MHHSPVRRALTSTQPYLRAICSVFSIEVNQDRKEDVDSAKLLDELPLDKVRGACIDQSMHADEDNARGMFTVICRVGSFVGLSK